jgi:hypothetical protein
MWGTFLCFVSVKTPHLGGWGVEILGLRVDIQDLESEPE